MAFKLSLTEFVILTISVLALTIGGIFLINLAIFSQDIIETDLPTNYLEEQIEQGIQVEIVAAPSAQQGTVFVVTAHSWPPSESQALPITIEGNEQQLEMILFDDGNHYDGEAKDGKYGALLDTSSIALGDYIIRDLESNEIGEFTIYESSCTTLIGSPSHEKINFLLIPSGYEDIEEFKMDANRLILGEDSISQIEPFKSKFDEFSFAYVEPFEELGCEVGCKNIETMVCCDDAKILDAASQCHYDSIIVLVNSKVGCGTASYYAKVCTKSNLAGKTLTHELGHSFGGLADEYVYANFFDSYTISDDLIKRMPNCAEEGCEKWASVTDSCIKGCTSENLYRSSQNSIMRFVSNGQFNEVSQLALFREINKHIQRENQFHKSPQQRSYYVNMNYNDGQIKLGPPMTIPVRPGLLTTHGHFTANILDKDRNILESVQLPLPIIERPALDISEEPILQTQFALPVILPFIPNADSLEISDSSGTLATTSLAIFSERCGNGLCEESENRLSCSQDCTLEGDDFCELGLCDPDCPNQEGCAQQNKNYTLPVSIMILAIIAILIVTFRPYKRVNS